MCRGKGTCLAQHKSINQKSKKKKTCQKCLTMLKPFILFSIFSTAFLNVYWITRLPFLNFALDLEAILMQVVWPLRRNLPWQWQVPHSCSKFPHSKGMQWDLHQMSPMYIIKCIKCLILQIEQVKWEADNLILKKVQGQKVFRNILRDDMQNGQNGLERLSLTVTKLEFGVESQHGARG